MLVSSNTLFLVLQSQIVDTRKGNVSYVAPTLHSMFAIPTPEGAFPHHPSFAASAGTDEAHEEAIFTGKGLALTGWDMLCDDGLFELAKAQWEGQLPAPAHK
jgi:hypothetical protein